MKPIHLLGMPSLIGGACRESLDTALLWRAQDWPVSIVPLKDEPDTPCERRLLAAGCKIHHGYLPLNAVCVDFSDEQSRKIMAGIGTTGCKLVHVPCMAESVFPHELEVFKDYPPDAVVFQSEFQSGALTNLYASWGVPIERQHLIRGAFDQTAFAFNPRKHEPGDPFVVARIARPVADKWPKRLIETIEGVRNAGVECRGVFLGWTPDMEEFTGPLPEWICDYAPGSLLPEEVYWQVHALLCLGPHENWPRVGLEAMAAGVPVVADNYSGWMEMIDDCKTGILAADTDEAIKSILWIAHSERYRQHFIANARESLQELASPLLIGCGWSMLFENL